MDRLEKKGNGMDARKGGRGWVDVRGCEREKLKVKDTRRGVDGLRMREETNG